MEGNRSVKLQTTKVKLTNSMWEYREFIIEKEEEFWIIKKVKNSKFNSLLNFKDTLIKECCLKIDDALGEIPIEIKKQEKILKKEIQFSAEAIPKKGYGSKNLNCDDAKVKAYEFRNDKNLNIGVPNKSKSLGLIGHSLIWNREVLDMDKYINIYNQKYKNIFKFTYEIKNNQTILEVNVVF